MGRPPISVQRARSEAHRDRIVEFVTAFHRDNGYGPSLREIADGIGLSLSSTTYHVGQLKEADVLVCEARKPRSIRVAERMEMHSREPG
jgi:SOS-response transcriptional repressor LexA